MPNNKPEPMGMSHGAALMYNSRGIPEDRSCRQWIFADAKRCDLCGQKIGRPVVQGTLRPTPAGLKVCSSCAVKEEWLPTRERLIRTSILNIDPTCFDVAQRALKMAEEPHAWTADSHLFIYFSLMASIAERFDRESGDGSGRVGSEILADMMAERTNSGVPVWPRDMLEHYWQCINATHTLMQNC